MAVGAAAGVQAYRLNVQRQMLRLEQQASLERERTRIAQDMHDDLGANLTKIAIMTEVARQSPSLPGGVGNQLQQVSEMARNVVDSITEIIWAVNPRHDHLDNLCAYLREYTSQALEPTSIRCHVQFPEQIPSIPLSAEMRRNIFLVVKEALHNIIKHSQARNAYLQLSLLDPLHEPSIGARTALSARTCPKQLADMAVRAPADEFLLRLRGAKLVNMSRDPLPALAASNPVPHLEIAISDDGFGFDPASLENRGDGLRNMANRIATLRCVFEIESKPGAGTTVRFRVPLTSTALAHTTFM